VAWNAWQLSAEGIVLDHPPFEEFGGASKGTEFHEPFSVASRQRKATFPVPPVANPAVVRVLAGPQVIPEGWIQANVNEGAYPVPFRLAVCTLPALSLTLSVPVRGPGVVGVNDTLIEQLAREARELPQLLVCAKSPLALIPLIDRVPDPLLTSMTVWVELVVPTFCPPNIRPVGVRLADPHEASQETVTWYVASDDVPAGHAAVFADTPVRSEVWIV
jgi:hypothetical protein